MEEVQVVVAHQQCVTLRVGDVFLKIDSDQSRTDIEVEAMALAPIPTPEVLWRKPPVLALAALPGTALARLGEPSTASAAAWAGVGAVIRTLHDAPLPPWHGRSLDGLASQLDGECEWLISSGVLPRDLVTRNRRVAEAVLRPWKPVFTHGDLQVAHVFVDGDKITGVVDWTEAIQGDALYDLAILTLGHPERLGDIVAGYGTDVDLGLIRAWWSFRCLQAIRWLIEHGFDPFTPGCEVDVLRSCSGNSQYHDATMGTTDHLQRKVKTMTDEKAPDMTWHCRYCGSTNGRSPTPYTPLTARDMAYCSDCGKVTPPMAPPPSERQS